jgi:hypothetical protein
VLVLLLLCRCFRCCCCSVDAAKSVAPFWPPLLLLVSGAPAAAVAGVGYHHREKATHHTPQPNPNVTQLLSELVDDPLRPQGIRSPDETHKVESALVSCRRSSRHAPPQVTQTSGVCSLLGNFFCIIIIKMVHPTSHFVAVVDSVSTDYVQTVSDTE